MIIQSHPLWKLLHEKAQLQNRNTASSFETEVEKICQYGINLSKTIRDSFRTYTLHDETHISNIMDHMLMLLGDAQGRLTRDECAMLIMSACCHDIGMSVTQKEKEYLQGCPDCMQIYLSNAYEDYVAAYADGISEEANITDEILQHYIRANHHKRVWEKLQEYVKGEGNTWLAVLGNSITLYDLAEVCRSHGENAEDIRKLQNFSSDLDLRLCAILLRLSDILDFDMSRAPYSLYQYINLVQLDETEHETSRGEWKMHQASGGFTISQDEHQMPILLYKADCNNLQTEQAIVAYLNWVDEELEKCWDLVPDMEIRWRDLKLPNKLKRKITVNGYLSGEYKLTLDKEQVLDLLIGENLYPDAAIFVRELIQNAIDAVRTRKRLDKNLPKNWTPQINIRTWVDADGFYWFCIKDNGMGMTEKMIRESFLKVGHSYYQSSQFQIDKLRSQSDLDYKPISRFGIGFLSCFMGGSQNNQIEMTTRHFQEYHTPYPAYRLSIQGSRGYYYLADSINHRITAPAMPNSSFCFIEEPGTEIAIKTSLFQSGGVRGFQEIIDQYVVYPEIPIHYEAEEIGCSYDYLTEEEFMEALHHAVPKAEDGIYGPVGHIDLDESIFKGIQAYYPELKWEEKPRVDLFCMPLDYFTDSPLIKGAALVARCSGKAGWHAEGLDEKYIPAIELVLAPIAEEPATGRVKPALLIINFTMPHNNAVELKRRIIPKLRTFLSQSGVDTSLSPDTFFALLNAIPFESIQGIEGVTKEEFRALQAILMGRVWVELDHVFENVSCFQPWFGKYFKSGGFIYEGNCSVNAHNGIYIDDSQLLVYGNAVVSNTIVILKDRYCPRLGLSRNFIYSLPLETVCQLDAVTDQILCTMGISKRCFDDRKMRYHYRYAVDDAPLKDYLEIFGRIPGLMSRLYFITELGGMSLPELKKELGQKDKIYVDIRQSRPVHMAALISNFNLEIAAFECYNDRRILVTRKDSPFNLDKYLDFPPALFMSVVQKDGSVLSGCDKLLLNSNFPYNEAHPFSNWLICNRETLQCKVPGIYSQMILKLISGNEIIQSINKNLDQLRRIPKLGVEVFRDLTVDDFYVYTSVLTPLFDNVDREK